MSDPRLLIFTHDRIREFFDVPKKTRPRHVASKLLNAIGDQLLGLVVLNRLLDRDQISPEQRSDYEMNAMMYRFVKEDLFEDDRMEFKKHFGSRNTHSVGDIFEAWIFFAYEAHDRNLEKLTNVLEPYLTWVESHKTKQISNTQPTIGLPTIAETTALLLSRKRQRSENDEEEEEEVSLPRRSQILTLFRPMVEF